MWVENPKSQVKNFKLEQWDDVRTVGGGWYCYTNTPTVIITQANPQKVSFIMHIHFYNIQPAPNLKAKLSCKQLQVNDKMA